MSRVTFAWMPLGLCVVMSLLVVGIAIADLAISEPGQALDALSVVAPMLAYPAVGALALSRRRNRIGFVFSAAGLALACNWTGDIYAHYALLDKPGSLPGGVAFEWLSNGAQVSMVCLIGILMLLFPEGRPRSRRAAGVLWLLVAAGILGALAYGLGERSFDPPFEAFRNPLGIPGTEDPFGALAALAWLGCLAGVLAAAVSLIARLRSAVGIERLQLKWMVFAAAVLAAIFLLGFWTFFVPVSDSVERVRGVVFSLAAAGVGVAAGIAVLRHRLYEIDTVINRTVVYSALTTTLAGAYLGSVVLLQLALDPITSGSSLAVAVSTLLVAALFRPARARIQEAVDRRFYRRRYNAAQTLAGFSARLREQVDLEALAGDLREVVRETMQPAHVSLWLRTPEEASR